MKTIPAVKEAEKLVMLRTKERDAILETVIAARDDRDAFTELHPDMKIDEIDYYQCESEDVAARKAVAVAEEYWSKEIVLNLAMRKLVKAHALVMQANDEVLYQACQDDAMAAEAEWEAEHAGRERVKPAAAAVKAAGAAPTKAPGGKHDSTQVREIIRKVAANLGRHSALDILDQYGGATAIMNLKPEFFDAVYEACQALLSAESEGAEADMA